ncbi:hypothetical protein [[Phormidium] sp. ETS-05]|uniref:hypothetical protein n=1 Tax=[Phormidium] sp. ETS-05 TaxID=222819 RepID=UPI0018EEEFDA|nr:hypothetical protein [[Phormidium] sp. ETS-05]
MTKILPWGKLLATNAAGFILNDCHQDKILPPWTRLVTELRETCWQVWSTHLQQLYLRGSVPRGFAIPQVSDLDSFAILNGTITATDLDLSRNIARELKKRYLFCKKVELLLLSWEDIYQEKSVWPGIIQTKSLKIAGDDRPLNLPEFKPGVALINYAYTWETDLAQTLDILAKLSPHNLNFAVAVKKQCAWITRRMIRTGFELVMERDQSYTPDLYYCCERFSVYFPEQKAAMQKALELAIIPSANRPGLIVFLRGFGFWLLERVQEKFYPPIASEGSTNNMP